MFRSKAERKVQEAGYDPARLPPGQYLTEKWPILHAGSVARYDDLSTWTFRVFGDVEQEDAVLPTHADGGPLTPDHGTPLRLVIPGKYFWKSAKWLRGIELSSIDKPGFWERYGYHNDADPWREERYGF